MLCSRLAFLAVVLLLGQVQCQSDFDRDIWEREFDRDFERDQTAEECVGKVMDIFFLLDSSTSIYINDFKQEHQFAREVVKRFDVSSRNTRVGLLTFSDDYTRPPLGFSRFQTKSDVLQSINEQNLPYRTGVTNTDQAIRYVRESNEFRQDITKVMVVVTDGGSRSPGSTEREARLARDQGFYLFVVGVGQYLDEREWRSIATDPDESFIYNITNFRFLDSVQYSLPSRACGLPPIIIGGFCNVEAPSDLYFVAGPGGTQEAVQLIDNFVDRSDDPRNDLRVTYLMDVCDNAENVLLGNIDQYCDRFAFPEEATPDTYVRLISRLRDSARQARNTRGSTSQVAVLFIDDESIRLNRFGITSAAREAAQDGIELIVVDLGVRGFQNFVQSITSNRDNFVRFTTGSLSAQRSTQKQLLDRTCDAINGEDDFDFNLRPNK